MRPNNSRTPERGNVFIFILLGLVLFAALSFTVARGFRSDTTNQMTARQAEIAASEMISYAQRVERGINRLRRNGCSETQISFDHPAFQGGHSYLSNFNSNALAPANFSCHLFHPNGASLTPVPFPQVAVEPQEPTSRFEDHFIPMVVHVNNIGTDYTSGSDSVRPTDLVLTAQFKSEQVCAAINKLSSFDSGVPDMTGTLNSNTFSTQGRFSGSYEESIIIRTRGAAVFDGKTTGCFYQGNGAISHQTFPRYIFYHILLAR